MVKGPQAFEETPNQSLNPYQSPSEVAPVAPVPLEAEAPPVPLRFWEGRKALLQSLFYMRCFALVTTLFALRAGYLLVQPYVQPQEAYPLGGTPPSLADFWVGTHFLLAALLLALTLVFCYIVWQFARNLQLVAGRRETDPSRLCQQHLLLWRLKVAILVAILLRQGLIYVQERTIASDIESMVKD